MLINNGMKHLFFTIMVLIQSSHGNNSQFHYFLYFKSYWFLKILIKFQIVQNIARRIQNASTILVCVRIPILAMVPTVGQVLKREFLKSSKRTITRQVPAQKDITPVLLMPPVLQKLMVIITSVFVTWALSVMVQLVIKVYF